MAEFLKLVCFLAWLNLFKKIYYVNDFFFFSIAYIATFDGGVYKIIYLFSHPAPITY